MRLASLYRPRSQQQSFGNAAPIAPTPYAGATMNHPYAASPLPYAPKATETPPSFLPSGNPAPYQTPFQNSVTTQRGIESQRAATFAAASPLPMRPVSIPAPTSMPNAPTTEYSGAYGVGPQAQQQAEAARMAYVTSHQNIANAQPIGPNGSNYFQNQGLQDDANDRANYPAPNSRDTLNNAKAGAIEAETPGRVDARDAKANRDNAAADSTRQLTPGRVEQQGARTAAIKSGATVAGRNADTNAAREQRLAGKADPAIAQMTRDNAHDITTAAANKHKAAVTMLNAKQHELTNIALTDQQRTAIQGEIKVLQGKVDQAATNYDAAIAKAATVRKAGTPTAKPAAGAAPTTQPTSPQASAVPEHVNPTTGQKANWDGTQWVIS